MPPRTEPRFAFLVLALLSLGACGGGAEPSHAGPTLERLALRSADELEAGELAVVHEYTLPAKGLPDWELSASSAKLATAEGTTHLELRAEGAQHVTVDLTVAPEHFNQVAVTLVPLRPCHVRIRAGRDDERGGASELQHVPPRRMPVTILFDLPSDAYADDVSHALTVSLFPQGGVPGVQWGVGLVSVALLHRPLDRWLPAPGERPELVILGEEARRGVGLASGYAGLASFEAGDWNQLSLGLGSAPISADAPAELRVTLSDEQGETREELLAATDTWETHGLDLDGLEGEVTVRLETEAPPGTEALLVVGNLRPERGRRDAPAVLLVTSDTHRADHLGVMDLGVDIETPAIDALAERGLLFDDCVVSANVTHPSHVALMSGYTPRDTGVVNNADVISNDPVMLAERFKAAGWATLAAVSAGSLDHPRSGLGQGFDRVFAPRFGIRDSADTLAALLEALPDVEGQPLFVWVHLFDAHTPYREHPDLRGRYWPEDRDPRDPALPELEPWQMAHGVPGVRDLDYAAALYRAEITYQDRQLARLFDHPRFADQIIAFTSDHGESLTSHNVWFGHEQLYPQTLHVPLILAWPGGPEGERRDHPVRQIDVGHTLLELAGLGAGEFPGRDLTAPAAAPEPRFALGSGALSASVHADRWFFVLHLRAHQLFDRSAPRIEAHTHELYDLAEDPSCEHERTEQHPEVVRQLRALLVDWLLDAPESGWNAPVDSAGAEALQELADLGYTTTMRSSTRTAWFDPDCDCEHCTRWK